jgi:hypothetical protein
MYFKIHASTETQTLLAESMGCFLYAIERAYIKSYENEVFFGNTTV